MKVFEFDESEVKALQKKGKIGAAISSVAGFLICLILFLVHSRSNTVIILPIVCLVASASACITLGIVLGRLGCLKQYAFVLKKAANASEKSVYTFVENDSRTVTRDHLRFTKSSFCDDCGNTVSFCVLVPHSLDLTQGQRVEIVHVDDILLSAEVVDE